MPEWNGLDWISLVAFVGGCGLGMWVCGMWGTLKTYLFLVAFVQLDGRKSGVAHDEIIIGEGEPHVLDDHSKRCIARDGYFGIQIKCRGVLSRVRNVGLSKGDRRAVNRRLNGPGDYLLDNDCGGDGHYGRQNECCNEEISKVSVSFEEANRFGSVVRGVIIWGWWVGGGAGEKSRILLLAIPGACVQTTFTLFLFFI